MKKFYLLLLILTATVQFSMSQVLQRKINANVAKPIEQPVKTTTTPAVTTAVPIKKISVIKATNIVPLNSKNAKYQKFVSNKVVNGVNSVLYSKQYSFSDGTKMNIKIINPSSRVVLLQQSNISNPKPNSTSTSNDDQNHCTTTNVTLTDNSNTFMNNNYAGQAPFIYPGAIYTNDHLFNGNFKEEKTGRNPIIITTDNTNMTGDSYEIVDNPDLASIHNAVTKLLQRFTTLPSSTSQQSFTEKVYESSTASDMAIKLGTDVSGYGGSFSGYINTQKDQKTEYLTIDCIKPLYTLSVAIPDSGYFAKNAGVNTSNLTVIGSVTYGSRVLANIKTNFNSDADEAGFSAGYSGWGIQAHADLSFFSNNNSVESTINAYYVGGPASTKPSFDKSQLINEITNFFGNSNYQNAVPISYELYDLDNNHLNYMTATDAFNIPLCIPNSLNNAVLSVADMSNIYAPKIPSNASYAYIKTGNNSGDNKDPDTHWSFGVFDANGNSVASFHDNSNNDPYNDGSTTGHLVISLQKAATFGSLSPNGRIHINIAPNGHDTWNIDEFTVFLNFTNPTTSQKLTWTGIGLSESKRDVDLNFHYDKNSNTLMADYYSN